MDSIIYYYTAECMYNRFICVGSCCTRSLFEVINLSINACADIIFQQNLSRMDNMKVYFERNSTEMDTLIFCTEIASLKANVY